MEPSSPRGLMSLATMAYALSIALVGMMSWRALGPWWGAVACTIVALIAAAGATAIWRAPSVWVDTTLALSLVATVALGASLPATVRGILAVGEGVIEAPTVMVTLVLVGIASTIYLAFAGTSLLEDRRLRVESLGYRPATVGAPAGYAVAGR